MTKRASLVGLGGRPDVSSNAIGNIAAKVICSRHFRSSSVVYGPRLWSRQILFALLGDADQGRRGRKTNGAVYGDARGMNRLSMLLPSPSCSILIA